MRWLKLIALAVVTLAISPLLLLLRYLDYASYSWFTVLAKQYLSDDE